MAMAQMQQNQARAHVLQAQVPRAGQFPPHALASGSLPPAAATFSLPGPVPPAVQATGLAPPARRATAQDFDVKQTGEFKFCFDEALEAMKLVSAIQAGTISISSLAEKYAPVKAGVALGITGVSLVCAVMWAERTGDGSSMSTTFKDKSKNFVSGLVQRLTAYYNLRYQTGKSAAGTRRVWRGESSRAKPRTNASLHTFLVFKADTLAGLSHNAYTRTHNNTCRRQPAA